MGTHTAGNCHRAVRGRGPAIHEGSLSVSVERMVRWLPYALWTQPDDPAPVLLELGLLAGETDWATAIVNETVETLQVWPIDDVLKNFVLQTAVWYRLAHGDKNR